MYCTQLRSQWVDGSRHCSDIPPPPRFGPRSRGQALPLHAPEALRVARDGRVLHGAAHREEGGRRSGVRIL
jgi:hypothetical protein